MKSFEADDATVLQAARRTTTEAPINDPTGPSSVAEVEALHRAVVDEIYLHCESVMPELREKYHTSC